MSRPVVQVKIQICQNRTCKRQGSREVLNYGRELGVAFPPQIQLEGTGCLGNCGAGPNAVVTVGEGNPPVQLSHLNRPAALERLLKEVAGFEVDPGLLRALQLRKEGNDRARSGDPSGAILKYAEALALNPSSGKWALYSNLALARLDLGDARGALSDAEASGREAEAACVVWTKAWMRKAEALAALGDRPGAAEALEEAARKDPAAAATEEFRAVKERVAKAKR